MDSATYNRTIISQAGYRRIRVQGGVTILRLLDADPATLDAWHEDCYRLMATWRPGKRLRYVHDIRHAEKITPLAMDRVISILRQMRTLPVTDAKGAILVNNPPLARLIASFLRRRSLSHWRIRFFKDEAQALHWLAAHVEH